MGSPSDGELCGLSDEVLISLVQQGDQDAFAELWRRRGPRFRAIIQRMCCHREEVEDILQDFSLALHTKVLPAFDPQQGASWTTFAVRALRNKVIDFLRQKARRSRHVSLDGAPDVVAPSTSLDEPMPEQLWWDAKDCASRLEPEYRNIILLRHEGLTFSEISQQLFPKAVAERQAEFKRAQRDYELERKEWEARGASDAAPKPPRAPQAESLSFGKFKRAIDQVKKCLRSKGHDIPERPD